MQTTPEQYTGRAIDARSSREFPNRVSALRFFEVLKQRLENVNSWQPTAGEALAKFLLVDSGGNDVHRSPVEGDHFKIDVPGPGSREGQGHDWVQVETIYSEAEEDSDTFGFTVRPSPNPKMTSNETAHFYSDQSTSTFLIRREGQAVIAEIQDRNITPNSSAERTTDKIRNTVVGAMGSLAFSKIQWQSLTDGLISE